MTAPARLTGALMVCGTASDVGKSHVVTGLCRVLARAGVKVAPFKGQNMALNSTVTADGAEIGRAQAVQALAAGVEPEAAMNPVLLKPTGERTSQVMVMGRPWRTLDALAYQSAKAELVEVVSGALASLRARFDVVVCEGAGSPAEINLAAHDLVNLGLARRAGIPAVLVGDIDRGGVFAHLYGTTALLSDELRPLVRGFVLNKFRGDPALLGDATEVLLARTGVPTLGVLPWLADVALDAEDSLALRGPGPGGGEERGPASCGDPLEVVVVRFPRLSNFTDLDALAVEPDVSVRFAEHPGALGSPDLVVLPGTKSTLADLAWLRDSGFAGAIEARRRSAAPPVVLGICGGYQMLGRRIEDPGGVESDHGPVEGMGWLDAVTRFGPDKCTRRRRGTDPASGAQVTGYEIHHGRVDAAAGCPALFSLEAGEVEADEGVRDEAGRVFGTSLHGIFESDPFRQAFLADVARLRHKRRLPSSVCFAARRQSQLDRLADACAAHLDLPALWAIVAAGAGS